MKILGFVSYRKLGNTEGLVKEAKVFEREDEIMKRARKYRSFPYEATKKDDSKI